MTEPDTGSDLSAIRTSAVRDGDEFIINGQKTFISNGVHADLVIVACRTGGKDSGAKGLSLLCVERETPGFQRGRRLEKMGMHA